MIQALGYSQTTFDARAPGRLCRGRERWIEPWDPKGEPPPMHRLVLSGATFSDDSAADARRGLTWSGLELPSLIAQLFQRKPLLAFMEDGHPADIPPMAEGIEAYEGYRAGGRTEIGLVRWHGWVSGVRDIRLIVGEDAIEERVRGFVQVDPEVDVDELMERVFLLVGMSTLDSPPARYQPAALPEVLELAKAVVLVHRDKHGPALGIYSREPLQVEKKLQALCDKSGTLLVPFAIPPMLARWDRALSELRSWWMSNRDDEFPVPPAPESSGWEGRRRRRRDRRDRKSATGEE